MRSLEEQLWVQVEEPSRHPRRRPGAGSQGKESGELDAKDEIEQRELLFTCLAGGGTISTSSMLRSECREDLGGV